MSTSGSTSGLLAGGRRAAARGLRWPISSALRRRLFDAALLPARHHQRNPTTSATPLNRTIGVEAFDTTSGAGFQAASPSTHRGAADPRRRRREAGVLVDGGEPARFDQVTTGRAAIFTAGRLVRAFAPKPRRQRVSRLGRRPPSSWAGPSPRRRPPLRNGSGRRGGWTPTSRPPVARARRTVRAPTGPTGQPWSPPPDASNIDGPGEPSAGVRRWRWADPRSRYPPSRADRG